MRNILLITVLFLALSVGAQPQLHEPAAGREPMRGMLCPTPQLDPAPRTPNSYYQFVEWVAAGDDTFTATCSRPFAWANRQTILRVQGAPSAYELRANGHCVASVQTGALPAEFNLTKYLKEGSNHLEMRLLPDHAGMRLEDFSVAHPSRPGASALISQPTIRVRDVVTRCRKVENGYLGEVAIVVKCDALNRKEARIHYELQDAVGRTVKQGAENITLSMRGEDTLRFQMALPDSMLWQPDSPVRYRLKLRTQTLGRYTEYLNLPVAFRCVELRDGALVLNGRPMATRLIEISRPLSREELLSLRASDSDFLLYPLPTLVDEAFYALCDEVGVGIVAQTPLSTRLSGASRLVGGNPSNDPSFVPLYVDRVTSTIYLAQRHPSVLGISMAEDSSNGIALYEAYLAAQTLDCALPILYLDSAAEWNSDPWHVTDRRAWE